MYSLALAPGRPSAMTVRSAVATLRNRRSAEAGPDRLHLEIGVQVRVPHLAPDPGRLVSAERRRRVARAPDVHVDRPRLEHRRQPVGVADVARPDTRRQPVLGVVRAPRDLLEVVVRHRHQDRPEDLLAGYAHVVAHAGEERRTHEQPVPVPADHPLGALLLARPDVRHHSLELLLRDDWSELGFRIEPRANASLLGASRDAGYDLVELVTVNV